LVKTFDVDMVTSGLRSVSMIFGLLKGAESLTPQYRSDLFNPSEGEINSGKLRSRKQSVFFSFRKFF
jgi:hypothetical protein